jgi:hypothetical protein
MTLVMPPELSVVIIVIKSKVLKVTSIKRNVTISNISNVTHSECCSIVIIRKVVISKVIISIVVVSHK